MLKNKEKRANIVDPVSSGSSVFANSVIVVFGALRVSFDCKLIPIWNWQQFASKTLFITVFDPFAYSL